MLRYSLTSLFLILVYACIGCAALASATGIWPQVVMSMTVAILLAYTLAAICWKERARYFALGFSITGWIYFLLIFTSVLNVRGYLLTDTAVDLLFRSIHEDQTPSNYQVVFQTVPSPSGTRITQRLVPLTIPQPAPPATALPAPAAYTYYAVTSNTAGRLAVPPTVPAVDAASFANIGHSLWAVLLACLGGVVAQVLYARSKRSETPRSGEIPTNTESKS